MVFEVSVLKWGILFYPKLYYLILECPTKRMFEPYKGYQFSLSYKSINRVRVQEPSPHTPIQNSREYPPGAKASNVVTVWEPKAHKRPFNRRTFFNLSNSNSNTVHQHNLFTFNFQYHVLDINVLFGAHYMAGVEA